MTHKNPALRAQGPVVSEKPTLAPKPASPKAAAKVAKPPKCELVAKKWVVVCEAFFGLVGIFP